MPGVELSERQTVALESLTEQDPAVRIIGLAYRDGEMGGAPIAKFRTGRTVVVDDDGYICSERRFQTRFDVTNAGYLREHA